MIFLEGSSVHLLCTQLYYICFRPIWVLDGGCWAKMGCCNGRGTKVENHWFSATVSNAEQRQEQSFRTVPRTTPERKGSHLARKFACSWFHLLPLWWLFVCSFKSENLACIRVGKSEAHFIFYFGHSSTMVDEKYFRLKWTHFRKIYKGRLSFFSSWRHFLDTSRLTKILEGTVMGWLVNTALHIFPHPQQS